MAALLSGEPRVTGYVGVDASPEMAAKARWLIGQLAVGGFSVVETRIESFTQRGFDFGLSIHSHYAWVDPVAVLTHIRSLLRPGASFVLVTPNRNLDMPLLLARADKELLGNPGYPAFKALNLELAGAGREAFVSMDELVGQAHRAGFLLTACHQDFLSRAG